jgi:HEAT repeat protein
MAELDNFNLEPTQPLSAAQVAEMLADEGKRDDVVSLRLRAALGQLTEPDLKLIAPVWAAIPTVRRQELTEAMLEESADRFDLDYDPIAFWVLDDPDAGVRSRAIRLLAFTNESRIFMTRLKQIAQQDSDVQVRAEAASALGAFILLGEYEELAEGDLVDLVDFLTSVWADESEDVQVRRRALESLGNSSAAGINDLIADAYDSGDNRLRVSAVFAMGRTCDKDTWAETIRRELTSTDDEVRFEAVRAAGELELYKTVPTLHTMALNDLPEIRKAAILALGEIGNQQAQRYLMEIAEIVEESGDDPELEEIVTEALENATLPFFAGDIDDDDED